MKLYKKIIIGVIACSLLFAIVCGIYIFSIHISKSHIFYSDNAYKHSDFDNWLLEEVGVKDVPTYVIIRNNAVIGLIDGNVDEKEFSSNLGDILANPNTLSYLPRYEITNIEGETLLLSDIMTEEDRCYILEISWIDCEECTYQDEHYTNVIYANNSTKYIYRYYINSERYKIIQKYHYKL